MSAEEIGIIVLLILVVVGPQRLPEYAEQLAKLVKKGKAMATGATESIREELGDEIADIDFTKFDPRQYDPRRIVREALLEDIIPSTKPVSSKTPTRPRTSPAARKATAAAAAAGTAGAVAAGAAPVADVQDAPTTEVQDAPVTDVQDAPVPVAAGAVGAADGPPPFDDEAT